MNSIRIGIALFVCALTTVGAQRFEFFPGGTYDPNIPTPASVLGYDIGTYHTGYPGLERWLEALKKSDRVRILRYGMSEEKRPLYLIVISSPTNLARLDEIRAAMARLHDPRGTTDSEAAQIASSMPAVAWMNHANDGNESAAFESAIQTSYQLAAGTDQTTNIILQRLVTIVNPAHNPESHERFVTWYNSVQVTGAGTADRQAAEHHAPWGMSTNNNHFQIDLNRDAFFQSQIETKQLVKAFGEWNPVVFVDHHGQTKNMFFPPPADAINLNVTPNQLDWMNRYGNEIGDAFDRQGWSYYRRGRFDLFFAGFWDSWPTLNGSIGMTFETDGGGSKGLAWEREDGTTLTLRDGVVHHHTGTMAVLKLTAEHKDQRLKDFYQFKKSAIEEGQKDSLKAVVLLPGRDDARARELVEVLRSQRIDVHRTTRPVRAARTFSYFGGDAAARDIPAGAYVVPMNQPQKRLAKALLELEPGFTKEFLENERKKKERAELVGERPRDGFYDTTAWTLPLLFGVDAFWSENAIDIAGTEKLTAPDGSPGDGGAGRTDGIRSLQAAGQGAIRLRVHAGQHERDAPHGGSAARRLQCRGRIRAVQGRRPGLPARKHHRADRAQSGCAPRADAEGRRGHHRPGPRNRRAAIRARADRSRSRRGPGDRACEAAHCGDQRRAHRRSILPGRAGSRWSGGLATRLRR